MDDRLIASGVRLGDRQAVAELHDRYVDVLHDYAVRRTPTMADAGHLVRDAFGVAVERMAQLPNPDLLRPWLYAIARTELHRRDRHPVHYPELAAAPGDGADLELLDLHLRHGLTGDELAAAVGMPAGRVAAALGRARKRLDRGVGAGSLAAVPMVAAPAELRRLLVASTGRAVPVERRWELDGYAWPVPERPERRLPLWAGVPVLVVLVIVGAFLVARPDGDGSLAVNDTTVPRPTVTTSPFPYTGVTPTGSSAPQPTTAEPTTTPSRTTTTTSTTTPTPEPPPQLPEPTTMVRDTEPPAVGTATLGPATFTTSARWSSCDRLPVTATASVSISDPSGVGPVTIYWFGPAGSGGSRNFPAGPGGTYTLPVGPVDGEDLGSGYYQVTISVVTADAFGNEVEARTSLPRAVRDCSWR